VVVFNIMQPKFFDKAVLEGPEETFNPAFSLRRISRNKNNAYFLQSSFNLSIVLLLSYFNVQTSVAGSSKMAALSA